jgi:hypothetical protein
MLSNYNKNSNITDMTVLKTKKCKKMSFVVTSLTCRIHIFYFPVVFLYAYRETSHRSFYHLKKLKFSANNSVLSKNELCFRKGEKGEE